MLATMGQREREKEKRNYVGTYRPISNIGVDLMFSMFKSIYIAVISTRNEEDHACYFPKCAMPKTTYVRKNTTYG